MNISGMPPLRERTMLLTVRMWLESSEPTGFRAEVNEIPDLERDLGRTTAFGQVDRAIEHVTTRIRSFARGEDDD